MQINCLASPQFENLGPYLVQLGRCPSCGALVPHAIDLCSQKLHGVCSDSLYITSAELARDAAAMAAKRATALPGDASPAGPPDTDEMSREWLVEQVPRLRA